MSASIMRPRFDARALRRHEVEEIAEHGDRAGGERVADELEALHEEPDDADAQRASQRRSAIRA